MNTKMKMNMTKVEHEIVKYGNTFAFGFVLDIPKQKKKKKNSGQENSENTKALHT